MAITAGTARAATWTNLGSAKAARFSERTRRCRTPRSNIWVQTSLGPDTVARVSTSDGAVLLKIQ